MNQRERVKEYMEVFGSITSMDAFRDLGVVKLSNRISELRASGVKIDQDTECSRNRFGEPVHYERYRLSKSGPASEENPL